MDKVTLTVTVTPEQASQILSLLGRETKMTGIHDEARQLKTARSFVKFVRRVPTQSLIVDELIARGGQMSYEDLVKAHNGKGGPSLAGCLSSITKNWQKSGGSGKFFHSESADGKSWTYTIDSMFVEPLQHARRELAKNSKFKLPVGA